jgi:hypothetical protein
MKKVVSTYLWVVVVDLDDSYHWQLLLFCLIVLFLFHALLHTQSAKARSARMRLLGHERRS